MYILMMWKRLSRYWPFVMGVHRPPVKDLYPPPPPPPQKEPVAPALVFSLVSTYRRCWTNIRVSDDLKRYILPYMCHKSANKDPVCEFYLTYERYHADGLVQDYSNPIVNALELLQSSTKLSMLFMYLLRLHNDVIKWTHFQRYWPFVRGIHQSPVNSPHKYATMMTS